MASVSTSSSSALNSTLGSSPLHRLASYFEKARKRAGIITLPSPALDTIRQYREQWSQHSGREVDAIVRALEPTSTDETLHGSGSISQAVAERQSKKIFIGQQALIALIRGFTKRENSDQTRRWMGVLALELLRGCEQNITLLRDDTLTLQSLNEVIEHGKCQVLKLLAGSMIHTMLSAGVLSEVIWPNETDKGLYSQFPRDDLYDTQWITAFEGFVEELGSRSAHAQQKSCVLFAFALHVGPSRYVTHEESAILVTVSEEINIIIPNSATGPATYVDVPLDRVHSAMIDSRANSQSQTPSHVLVMKLSYVDGTSCYLNALANGSDSIALVFADENDAKTLMRLIQPKTLDGKKAEYYGQSEEVDVSQAHSDDISADGLAVSLPRNVEESRDMITQETPFAYPPAGTSFWASQVLPILSPRQLSVTTPKQQPSNVAPYVEPSMSVSMGVDVSLPAPPSDTQTKARSSRGPFTDHIASQRILKTFDRTSDTGLPSSVVRKKASDSIDNAPEFRSPNDNTVVQQAAEALSPQADGYDSTYDVSPQNRQKRSGPAQYHSSSPQLLPIPNGKLGGHHSADPGAHPKGQETSLVSSHVAIASKLQQSSKADILTKVSGPSATGDGSTDEVPSKKSNRRLRNIEAEAVEPSANPTPRSLAGRLAQKTTESGKSLKAKILPIPETQAEILKQAKPARKPAVTKGKRKARIDRVTARGDEYDLLSSPEPTAPIRNSDTVTSNKQIQNLPQECGGPNGNAKSNAGPSAHKASNLGSKFVPKAKTLRNQPQKSEAPEKALIQERRSPNTSELPEGPLHKKVKHANTRSLPAPKEKKASRLRAKPKAKPNPQIKVLSAPSGQTRPRPRRAAAIKANEKLQGLEENDEITDVDDVKITVPMKEPSAAINKAGNVSAKAASISGIVSPRESTGPAPSILQPPAQRPTSAEGADGSIKLDKTGRQKDPTFESKMNTSSPEKINISPEPSLPPNPVTYEDAKTKETCTNGNPVSPSLRNVAVPDDPLVQEAKQSVHDDIAGCDHEERNKQPEQHSIPKDFNKLPDEMGETGEIMASDIIPEHHLQQVQLGMMGDIEGSHFQEAMPETDGESPHSNQAQKAFDTVADVKASDQPTKIQKPLPKVHRGNGETMPGIDGKSLDLDHGRKPLDMAEDLARPKKSIDVRKVPRHGRGEVAVDNRNSHGQAKDPFEAKLGPLVSMSEVATSYTPAQDSDKTRMVRGPKTLSTKHSKIVSEISTRPSTKAEGINEATKPALIPGDSQKKPLEQTIALPNDKLSELAHGEKRIVDGDYGKKDKSSKTRANEARAKVEEGKEVTRTETPLPVTGLKPGLISWTVSGPRNQGTLSAKKKITLKNAHATQHDKRRKAAEHDDKNQLASYLDNPSSWKHDHRTRPQARVHPTPRHNPKHVPPMRPELQVSAIQEKPHRLSSQSTKVDVNGSPMPFVDQSRQDVRHEATPSDVKSPFGHDDMLAEENDHYEYDEPRLPTLENNGLPKANGLAFASMTSNRKEVPSSPHAPSTLGIIPPHVILRNGEMVNEQTLESIVPTIPQDPFVGGNKRPPSSFMDLLHKSIAAEQRRKSGDANKQKSPRLVKRKSIVEEEDPDETLVEPAPKRQKKAYYTALESSSTIETTSRDTTPAKAPSDQESDSTTTRWQKTLEPHQSNMLDVLSHITHRLVRHLVDRETAAKDIVKDYEMRGNNLLQGYDKGRRQDLEADVARLELSKKDLAIMYTQAQKNVRKLSKDMSKRSTCALGARLAQWHQQQQGVGSAIERAIEACVEG